MRVLRCLLSLGLLGCATMGRQPQPKEVDLLADLELTSVTRTTTVTRVYDRHAIKTASNGASTTYSFSDSLVRITWLPLRTEFPFQLDNLTNAPLKVIWDSTQFLGPDGVIGKVVHLGVKYAERDFPQPTVVLAANATMRDEVVPIGAIRSGFLGGWMADPWFVPSTVIETDAAALEAARGRLEGRHVKIRLPLLVSGSASEYLFDFTIKRIYLGVENSQVAGQSE